ncbi:MAG TPA: glycosyltransferase family 87 protein [Terriglobales bacterium]|nr:glycosyltransferase family 87 protein [Terriglobales bacterium]
MAALMDVPIKRRLLIYAVLLIATAACLSRWGHKPLHFGPRSDIYPRWFGSRELFLHGLDPYSETVTQQIQLMYYDRPLAPGESRDEQRFAYPIYVSFLMLPTVLLPFREVQIIFVICLALATAASVFFWLRFVKWDTSRVGMVLILILTLCNPGTMRGLRLQQPGLLVAALLAAAAFSVANGRLVMTGTLLGFATIKPQTMFLPLIWFVIWCAGGWSKRKSLLIAFFGTAFFLCLAGELLLRGWIPEFIHGMIAYRRYAGYTGLEILFGRNPLATLATALILLWMGLRMWRNRKVDADSQQFVTQLSSILAIELLVMPGMFDLYNVVLLLPGIFVLLKPKSGLPITAGAAARA